jgi:AraC family transcriptional regulator
MQTQDYQHELLGTAGTREFCALRVRSDSSRLQRIPSSEVDDALLLGVSLAPLGINQWHARYGGQDVGVTRTIAFATTVLDLRCPLDMWIRGPFDFLIYYLSGALLKRVAQENEIEIRRDVRAMFFVEDLVVAQLTRWILTAVGRGTPPDDATFDQIARISSAHVLQRYCGLTRAATNTPRGLQTWQKLRVEEMLRAQLDGPVTIAELARACSLSVSHFARCFARSFGASVHRYRIRLRVEQAKTLLMTTDAPLAEIAALCGFCDQAAFSRAFSKIEQLTPARWRKINSVS